jgi:hypothetical protein
MPDVPESHAVAARDDRSSSSPPSAGSDQAVCNAPLTWGQEVLWYLHEVSPEKRRATFNVCLELDLPAGLTVESCRSAVREVALRHEALRTLLARQQDGLPQQAIQPLPADSVPLTRIDGNASEDALSEARSRLVDVPFDLYSELPIRVGVIHTEARATRLIVVVHHIVVDEWALLLLREELLSELLVRTAVR